MVETVFDIADVFGGIWFWYIFIVILIGIWANSKNRNPWLWILAALFFSPLLVGLILLFSGKLEKKKEKNKKNIFECQKCGQKFTKHDKYCPNCGNKFEDIKLGFAPEEGKIRCVKCHKTMKIGAKFCPHCGHKNK